MSGPSITTLAIATYIAMAGAPALGQVDPHRIYEGRCAGCHSEHGADLARQKFKLEKDVLIVARTGTRVDALLRRHHGITLIDSEIRPLLELFKSGIKWAGVYQRLCARCHDKAVAFARDRITLRDGELVSRRSGAAIESHLKDHGGGSDADTAILLEMLRYQLITQPARPTE